MTHNNIFYGHKNVKVTFQPNIGLDTTVRQSVIDILNLLLADEAVLSIKTHKAGGNIGETGVPDLKSLYETQYKQLNAISDEISERVQIMGGTHLRGFKKLLEHARLGVDLNAEIGPLNILADHEAYIRFLREDAQKCSEMYEDQGTFAMLVKIMRMHEKMAWTLRKNIALEQFDQTK
jgi:starvation-inducible DNA-binding protein